MPTDICLIGAGGHAIVVIDALRALDVSARIDLFDSDARVTGTARLGVVVQQFVKDRVAGRLYHVAIGDNASRARIAGELLSLAAFHTIRHPRSTIAASAALGTGTFVAAGAVVGPLAAVGSGAIINHNAVVDHECQVGDFTHIAPGATLGGRVRIGSRALIGAGANILPNRVVGDGAIVGAGAVVIEDVPAGVTVGGAPARTLRARG